MLETCTAPLAPEQSGVLMKVMSQSQQKELFSADFTQHFPPAGPYQPGAVPPPPLSPPARSSQHRGCSRVCSLTRSSTLKLFSVANQMSKQAPPVILRAFKQEDISR